MMILPAPDILQVIICKQIVLKLKHAGNTALPESLKTLANVTFVKMASIARVVIFSKPITSRQVI